MPKIPGWDGKLESDLGMWTLESVLDSVIVLSTKTFGERLKPIARASGLLQQVYACVFEGV